MRVQRALFPTERQKLVFRLVRVKGVSQKVVAEQLDVSQSAVCQTLSAAENRITRLLKECGFQHFSQLAPVLNLN